MLRIGTAFRSRADGSESRGQSEVIGVILMTAIAVVLASVMAQYVLGIDLVQSSEESVGPQISFETTVEDDGDLTIEHQSGDEVDTGELTVTGSEGPNFDVSWQASGNPETEWTASESIRLGQNTRDPIDGETIRIVWESSTTDDSAVVLKYEYDP